MNRDTIAPQGVALLIWAGRLLTTCMTRREGSVLRNGDHCRSVVPENHLYRFSLNVIMLADGPVS
jgi:hypothetical protein